MYAILPLVDKICVVVDNIVDVVVDVVMDCSISFLFVQI
jgi:hypothetical protein